MANVGNIYLYDTERWYLESDLDAYALKLQNARVTDLMPLIYGHFTGGSMGWTSSSALGVSTITSSTKLASLITAMDAKGIRVHGVFHVAKYRATGGVYSVDSNSYGKEMVDLRNASSPAFKDYIADLIAEAAAISGVYGVVLDYIYTDNYTSYTPAQNLTAVQDLVQDIYNHVKAVSSGKKVSSWGNPYYDKNHPAIARSGRDQIAWANAGLQDFIFAAEYGSYWTWQLTKSYKVGGNVGGKPPIMDFITNARALITNGTPIIPMARTFKMTNGVKTALGAGDEWTAVMDAMRKEQDIAFFDANYIADTQFTALAEHRRLHEWVT